MQKWFETNDQEKNCVISSRIRLSRNLDHYVFPSRLSEEEGLALVNYLEHGLMDLEEQRHFQFAMLEDLTELDRKALKERRLFNTSIAEKKAPVGLFVTDEEDVSIVLNGDDHIRIQVTGCGLHLDELWKQADQLDDFVNARFPYAFDRKYGYLTSFPTNVGTGLRAGVTLHLPSLSMGKKFGSMISEMSRFGTSVKGLYGEGADNFGSLYEVTNMKTLGLTEKEILDSVTKVANQLSTQERQVRELSLRKHALERGDEAYKSYGVLKYARRLSFKESMTYLSQLMCGVSDGLLKLENSCSIYRLMLGIQSANLLKNADHPLIKEELDMARAAYIRQELPQLMDDSASS